MGQVIAGRYELLELIARGGMGSVWVATDHQSGELVALKLLHQVEAVDLLRFVREAGVRLEHPHVLTPMRWAADDDQVVFAMPLVRGGSVAQLVADHGPLPAPFVAEVLRQLLAALDHVHGAGWVHRDVKPGNLLLDPAGPTEPPTVRLTDFGIAVETDAPRLTHTGEAGEIGTPGYLPPEASSGATPSPAHDLYAAGVCAQVLLTGTRASELPDDTPPPPGVPGGLWSVVQLLAHRDATRRVGSARDALAAPELAWPEGGVGVTVPDRLPPDAVLSSGSSRAPRRRRRWVPWALGAGLLGLVVAGGLGAMALSGEDRPPASSSSTSTTTAENPRWAGMRVEDGDDCVSAEVGSFAISSAGYPMTCDRGTTRWVATRTAPVVPHAILTVPPAGKPRWSEERPAMLTPCSRNGEYAVSGGGWLLRCDSSRWQAEQQYPLPGAKGSAAGWTPVWTATRVTYGTACEQAGVSMITQGGYPARCIPNKDKKLVWGFIKDGAPVHPQARRTTPTTAPQWSPQRPVAEGRCATNEQYAISKQGWLLRCIDKTWQLEAAYPMPPAQRSASSTSPTGAATGSTSS